MKIISDNSPSNSGHFSGVQAAGQTEAHWLLSDYESPKWTVLDNYGKTINILFNDLLPDGTYLSESVNKHWADTIRQVAFDCRSGYAATIESGGNQAAIVKAFVQLVSWMILNNRFSFSMLSSADVTRYINACSKGYETCLNTVERIQNALDEMVSEGISLGDISMKQAFAHAGIPWNRSNKMPHAKAAFYRITRVAHSISKKADAGNAGGSCSKLALSRQGIKNASVKIKRSTLSVKARPLILLWKFSSKLEDSLTFEPFPNGLTRAAKSLGKSGEHTRTIPIATAFFLAEQAVIWVTKIGPKLLELRASLDELITLKRGNERTRKVANLLNEFNTSEAGILLGKRVVLRKKKTDDTVILRTVLNGFLPAACYIVIAILTARRDIEISNLEVDAIAGSSETGWWLKSIVAKTLRRFDYTPCPQLVPQAVNLLKKVRDSVIDKESTNRLFIIPVTNGKTKKYVGFDIAQWLNPFASFVKVPKIELNGERADWKFAPHQFRRIFAILFVWRFERGDLGALSYHLRHFNIRMTMTYVRDTELRKIIGEEYHRLTVEKLKSVEAGDIKVAGVLGKLLSRTISRLRSQVDIFDASNMERKIIRIVEDRNLTLRPNLWGYCGASASPSNIRRSACQAPANVSRHLHVDGTPDPSGSDEITCAGCLFHFTDGTRLQHWVDLENDLIEKSKDSVYTKLIQTAVAARLSVVSSFLRNSFGYKGENELPTV